MTTMGAGGTHNPKETMIAVMTDPVTSADDLKAMNTIGEDATTITTIGAHAAMRTMTAARQVAAEDGPAIRKAIPKLLGAAGTNANPIGRESPTMTMMIAIDPAAAAAAGRVILRDTPKRPAVGGRSVDRPGVAQMMNITIEGE
jgi:hypothetical protein